MDNTREKLIDLITGFYGVDPMYYGVETQPLVDYLIANGVTFATDNNVGDKLTPTGCEYCQEDAEGYRRMIGAFSITNPFHGRTWQIETAHCKPREIFFCPMCGRKFPKKG